MGDFSDSHPNSRFPSAAPSSIPDDNDWSSRWSSSSSHPVSAAPSSVYDNLGEDSSLSVSVEIGPWDYTGGDNEPSASISFPVPHSDVHVIDKAPDIDARLGWEWKPSNIKWLDPGVSSQVTDFPHGMKLTDKTKIYALHRVKGCPSQFPFFSKRTAYLVDLTEMSDLDPKMTVDDTLRDQDSHSWLGSTGARNAPDAHIPGSFFGLTDDIKVACRRAAPFCAGVSACEALDSAFLAEERRELDPEPSRKLAAAVLRTREMQDDTDVGRTLAFYHSLQKWRCNGIHADGVRCDGSISLHKLNAPMRNKEHILLCSKRNEALIFNSLHSQVLILDHVSEEIFVKVMNGESIIEEDDTEGKCPRVVSARTGQKGKHRCPFNHHKNGRPYVAQIEPVTCAAKMMIFCPWESLHPTLACMALVVPYPKSGHTHPPPPAGKITQAVAARYRQCVRKIGLGATVSKVENAQSTKDLLDGKTPGLFHPGLLSRDAKTRLIQQVKDELNSLSSTGANTWQLATYIADQEVLSDEKRYLHSSLSRDGKRIIFGAHHKLLNSIHNLHTLNYNTTFKPVVGDMNIFEINGWLVGINESVTVMRVWMEIHDRAAFKAVWEEVQRLVLKLTRKRLKFKGLHKGGKILGLNSDMEAAPLLGFADAFVATIDLEDVRSVVGTDAQKLLPFVLRVCYSHYNRGIPLLSHLSKAIRQRIFNLKYLKTWAAFEAFKAWIQIVPDPHGVLRRWWEHKTMHRWLLPGLIQCLSNIPLEQWNTMEATTNLGEAQHAWNNNKTGTGMGALESFKKYEELDVRRAEEIELRKLTGISRNAHNEVSDRYANRTARQTRNSEKFRRAHNADATVAALVAELSEMREELTEARSEAETEPSSGAVDHVRVRELETAVVELESKLKQAKAEAKSNSSGRVRASKANVGAAGAVASTTLAETRAGSGSFAETAAASSTHAPESLEEVAVAPPVPPSPTVHVSSTVVAAMDTGDSEQAGVDLHRTSGRKRTQAEVSVSAPSVSNKRQKQPQDPLAGWVMEDPDTGEKLTGHEWVERNPGEFAEHYPKDHKRYLEYLKLQAQSS
ncbi:hypothetical protein B0H10DRAFT_2192985 [Mycena sp. CBHHK59/15]|nr:hypothetical protein B0H10DRAFT_2192985 [Mycena sp. CBHHK59/15]